VAIILVAPKKGVAALAHVVLPELRMTGGREAPPAKFADTAVPELLKELRLLRVKPEDLFAVLVGGATMFGHAKGSKLAGVGDRNVEAARESLAKVGIGVAAEDTGGKNGRSVQVLVGERRVVSKSGTEIANELKLPDNPLTVKVSAIKTDSEPEPFPDDIWALGSSEGQLTA
jgi:chemotaxis protein CheD